MTPLRFAEKLYKIIFSQYISNTQKGGEFLWVGALINKKSPESLSRILSILDSPIIKLSTQPFLDRAFLPSFPPLSLSPPSLPSYPPSKMSRFSHYR